MKQNRVPIFLGLYNYFHLRYKIEKSAYIYKLENEKFEKLGLHGVNVILYETQYLVVFLCAIKKLFSIILFTYIYIEYICN